MQLVLRTAGSTNYLPHFSDLPFKRHRHTEKQGLHPLRCALLKAFMNIYLFIETIIYKRGNEVCNSDETLYLQRKSPNRQHGHSHSVHYNQQPPPRNQHSVMTAGFHHKHTETAHFHDRFTLKALNTVGKQRQHPPERTSAAVTLF